MCCDAAPEDSSDQHDGERDAAAHDDGDRQRGSTRMLHVHDGHRRSTHEIMPAKEQIADEHRTRCQHPGAVVAHDVGRPVEVRRLLDDDLLDDVLDDVVVSGREIRPARRRSRRPRGRRRRRP